MSALVQANDVSTRLASEQASTRVGEGQGNEEMVAQQDDDESMPVDEPSSIEARVMLARAPRELIVFLHCCEILM